MSAVEWMKLAASMMAGFATLSAGMWINWLYQRIKDIGDELQREHEARVNAEIGLAASRSELGSEMARAARAEWELSKTKTAVHRMGWSQKWN